MNDLELMDMYYGRMLSCSSTRGRSNNYENMVAIYEKSKIVRYCWDLNPNAFYIINRFTRNSKAIELLKIFNKSMLTTELKCNIIIM